MIFRIVSILFAYLIGIVFTTASVAGTISLGWQPSEGAVGYRVYYGPESGVYTGSADVGYVLSTTLLGLTDCVEWYLAVKGYNADGESLEFSPELSGLPRPEIDSLSAQTVVQGGELVIEIVGSNFEPGVVAGLEAAPISFVGDPLIRLDTVEYQDCTRIRAFGTIEAVERGRRAMPTGDYLAGVHVLNPDAVYRSGVADLEVLFNADRWDINQSEPSTVDRVDGSDLAWLAFGWNNREGELRYNPDADLDGDGIVDGDDLALLAIGFGRCRSFPADEWSEESCT